VFMVFAFCFAGCLAVLEVIYRISVRDDGLATVNRNQHYLWTYGPTASESFLWGLGYMANL